MGRFFVTTLFMGLIVTGIAWLGYLPIRATSKPPGLEEAFFGRTLDASLKRQSKGLQNPVSVTDDELLPAIQLYRTNCAGCHGESGQPSRWGSTSFYPRVPQFAEEKPDLSAAEMYVATKYGIRYTGMAGWGELLSDREIWQVTTLLSHLDALPPASAERWKTSGETSPN